MNARNVLVASVILLFGCSREQLGLPRVELSIGSPDNRYVVEVHNEPELDPPNQSLWIGRSGGDLQKVTYVSKDGPKWTGPSAWSPNSELFAFAVADAYIGVTYAETGNLIYADRLRGSGVDEDVRSLTFDPTSTTLTVEFCHRRTQQCRDAHVALHAPTS